ncbi:MAG: hypothetical protein AABW56_01100 [Nanoarchaeota archaeon]
MRFNIFSESYLPWEDYCRVIEERERLVFLINTAEETLKNSISKEAK